MKNIFQVKQEAKEQFRKYKINSVSDIETLLCLILNVEYKDLIVKSEITDEEYKKFKKAINLRIKGNPIQKIIGYTDFLGVRISYNDKTLTPRQETEILAEMVVKYINSANNKEDSQSYTTSGSEDHHDKELKVLDLCCGSGCIGLSIAKNTNAIVTLVDISKHALKHTKQNAKSNKINNVKIIKSDLFQNIKDKFDIVVSNPPYIKREDLKTLENEVKKHDPMLALDGGITGYYFYENIIKKLPNYLNKGGKVFFEIGIYQDKKVSKMLEEHFEEIKIVKDYANINRFIMAKLKG